MLAGVRPGPHCGNSQRSPRTYKLDIRTGQAYSRSGHNTASTQANKLAFRRAQNAPKYAFRDPKIKTKIYREWHLLPIPSSYSWGLRRLHFCAFGIRLASTPIQILDRPLNSMPFPWLLLCTYSRVFPGADPGGV